MTQAWGVGGLNKSLIMNDGISPLQNNNEAIRKIAYSKNFSELRGVLGTHNFYRKFIPHIAKLAISLNVLLRKDVYFLCKNNATHALEEISTRITATETCICQI